MAIDPNGRGSVVAGFRECQEQLAQLRGYSFLERAESTEAQLAEVRKALNNEKALSDSYARVVMDAVGERDSHEAELANLQVAYQREIRRRMEAEAALQRAREERDALLEGLHKVRGHTSYVHPTMELLSGLLQSIERITDAYLASRGGGTA